MSDPFLPDRPAFAELRPETPCFTPETREWADQLRRVTGFGGPVARMQTGSDGVEGFYRVGSTVFLKVVSSRRRDTLVEAERLTRWLADRNLPVVTALPGFPRFWNEPGLFVFAYPWIEGRFARADLNDMRALGNVLARLHITLAELPWANRVQNAWAVRLRTLESARHRFLSNGNLNAIDADAVRSILDETAIAFEGGQPVHNDFHFTNLLFDASDTPIVLDFEDACHSFQPAIVDVAKALERFVLSAPEYRPDADWGRTLLEAYRDTGGPAHWRGAEDFIGARKVLAARALCELVLLQEKGISVPRSEWNKFIVLHEISEKTTLQMFS